MTRICPIEEFTIEMMVSTILYQFRETDNFYNNSKTRERTPNRTASILHKKWLTPTSNQSLPTLRLMRASESTS